MGTTRRHSPLAATLATAAVGLLAAGLTGCSSSSDDAATTTTTVFTPAATSAQTTLPPGSTTTLEVPEGWCQSFPPGQVLTPEQANVRVRDGAICPGYITVLPGTPITFSNLDSVDHTVVIGSELTPDEGVVDSKDLAPDDTWVVTYDADVTYNYFVTSFEGFRGVLQVGAEANHNAG
jgi:plastocyanin